MAVDPPSSMFWTTSCVSRLSLSAGFSLCLGPEASPNVVLVSGAFVGDCCGQSPAVRTPSSSSQDGSDSSPDPPSDPQKLPHHGPLPLAEFPAGSQSFPEVALPS
ncbi:hypothetical protein F7725_016267 [Dissostichus mawsoni]|uniref:Uncharacterized protein n=1 Tax=Dissostichus mawsoni TaxID=36200 RepID=A0A7J5Z159_DISMA|nr:hypothetical protein F7725_016267 [Dissostichus mawsoni]